MKTRTARNLRSARHMWARVGAPKNKPSSLPCSTMTDTRTNDEILQSILENARAFNVELAAYNDELASFHAHYVRSEEGLREMCVAPRLFPR